MCYRSFLASLSCVASIGCSHASPTPAPAHASWPSPTAKSSAAQVDTTCSALGSWRNLTPDVGESIITVSQQPDGSLAATEAGLGSFHGTARLVQSVLRIDFQTDAGYAGYYEWALDPSCSSGRGKLVFSAGGSGEHASSVRRAP